MFLMTFFIEQMARRLFTRFYSCGLWSIQKNVLQVVIVPNEVITLRTVLNIWVTELRNRNYSGKELWKETWFLSTPTVKSVDILNCIYQTYKYRFDFFGCHMWTQGNMNIRWFIFVQCLRSYPITQRLLQIII